MQDPTFQAINSAAAAGGSATTAAHNHHQLYPEQEQLKCPRCESTNTKFCYYNNYNLSQPRHFCKNCRRYWTKGGALRNIPVGGGTRKNNNKRSNSKRANSDAKPEPTRNKEPSSSSPSATSATTTATTTKIKQPAGNGIPGSGENPTRVCSLVADSDGKMLDMGGSFSSLLTSSGQFGSIFDGLNHNESGLKMVQMGGFAEDLNAGLNPDSDRHLGLDVQVSGNSNNGGGNSSGGDGDGYLQSSGDWGTSNGWPDLAIYTPGSNFQ